MVDGDEQRRPDLRRQRLPDPPHAARCCSRPRPTGRATSTFDQRPLPDPLRRPAVQPHRPGRRRTATTRAATRSTATTAASCSSTASGATTAIPTARASTTTRGGPSTGRLRLRPGDDDEFHTFDVRAERRRPEQPGRQGPRQLRQRLPRRWRTTTTCSSARWATTSSRATATSRTRRRRSPTSAPPAAPTAARRAPTARRRPDRRRRLRPGRRPRPDRLASTPATDGQDYIEGDGGNDIVFGGLGQDDIVGGSSNFFSLTDPNMRPDGADLIFGGSGDAHRPQRQRRHRTPATRDSRVTTPRARCRRDRRRQRPTSSASSASTASTSDRRRRDGCQIDADGRMYVSYAYDDTYGGERSSCAASTLLDYTPGGPDFRPDLFGLGTDGPCSTSAPQTQNGCGECSASPTRPAPTASCPPGIERDLRQRRGPRRTRRRLHLPRWRQRRRPTATPTTTTSSAAGATTGSPAASASTASSATTGASSPAATATPAGPPAATRTTRPTASEVATGRASASRCSAITAFQPQGTCTENKSVLLRRLPRSVHRHAGPGADRGHQHRWRPEEDRRPDAVRPRAVGAGSRRRPVVRRQQLRRRDLRWPRGRDPAELPERDRPPQQRGPAVRRDPRHPGRLPARWRRRRRDRRRRGDLERLHPGLRPVRTSGTPTATGASDAIRTDWTRPYNPGDLLHFGEDATPGTTRARS